MNDRTDVLRNALAQIESAVAQIRRELDGLDGAHPEHSASGPHIPNQEITLQTRDSSSLPSHKNLAIYQITAENPLSRPEQAVLASIAWLGQAQPLEMNYTLIAALAGYSSSKRTFHEALESLSKQELITTTADTAILTKRGSEIAAGSKTPLTSRILAERVAVQLTQHQSTIFLFLFEKRGTGVHQDEIVQKCGEGKSGKAFQKELFALQKLSLVKRIANNTYACAEMMFLD